MYIIEQMTNITKLTLSLYVGSRGNFSARFRKKDAIKVIAATTV